MQHRIEGDGNLYERLMSIKLWLGDYPEVVLFIQESLKIGPSPVFARPLCTSVNHNK